MAEIAAPAEDALVSALAHSRSATEVLEVLGSSGDGLDGDSARERLAAHGPNKLPEKRPRPAILRFFAQFNNVLIYILIAAGVLKAILNEWIDCAVILSVAVINAVVGLIQEGRAQRALDSIRGMLSVTAQVRRDGHWQQVDAQTLVPGDVVRIASGDRIPADMRLLTVANLRVEESALTGESLPAKKDVTQVGPDAGLGDRMSMVYSGTIVAAGSGTGVVTATGTSTEIGRIQSLIADVETIETPLTRKLARFGRQLSVGILGAAAVMLVIGKLVHQFTVDELITAAIGFAVAAIPEGLPAVVTITLALGVQQMARRRAITRKLPAVEALGAVNVICSDKTGTLTQNEMTARTVATARHLFGVTGTGYRPDGALELDGTSIDPADYPDLAALLTTMAVCNDARLNESEGQWRVVGEPTEGALRTLTLKAQIDDADWPRLGVVPFESANKFMVTLNDTPGGERYLYVKGAPDRLLDRSASQAGASSAEPLDRAAWEARIDELSGQGLRVLAAARRPAGSSDTVDIGDVSDGLEFLGVVGIVDPPRPEAVTAIATCHAAGIQVTMITGDHAGTAQAIAREMGIIKAGEAPRVLTGAELEEMSQTRLREVADDIHVYARTSPEHKLRIVSALQGQGKVVAMTGDGVNDAPALTRADIGVAMGIKGTEATKEAAGIILADDNFATIERAVEEGRRIYDNIRKSVLFMLPTNGAQSLIILVAILAGFALPLQPVQILWVNMVTSVTLSLALVFEKAEDGLMQRPPRTPKQALVNRADVAMIALVSILVAGATLAEFFVARAGGYPLAVAQTAAVNMLALGQLAYLLNCRFVTSSSLRPQVFRGNPWVWRMAGAMIALQLVFTYAPFMHTWFHSAPITFRGWSVAIALSIVIFLTIETAKWVGRRFMPTLVT
ncbi:MULTISPECIES: cation-translocating P-type ATPase [Mycolicibacterium]|uniref:P-type ATPase, translocating n=1 Tax=Mycolicibacterium senegalense TaxID=1796 RepID=A0A378W6S6_9MYCO|nr:MULTISPECIES: HAD-IC family P-type ATPase [Mycolicibacterium]MCV7335533.1 HAD-IC family P-type ATPase [Mycolicibacterium senegalense]MDR7288596.1 magnesium-transporting ATPase (P-type) [Mycolicibacterium senegalense]QZA25520.1 HAD-IC family P-type ATPase [Mycolicibacterium senegalense]CDP85318.1 P-type ATPase, translocating [Mycolicibacterium farcinogenes]SUA27830.1 P-type ATPase, translocating [Mycolicibacterium senegalense]